MWRRWTVLIPAVSVILMMAGCDGCDNDEDQLMDPLTIELSNAGPLTLVVGDSITIAAVLVGGKGSLSWQSSAPGVVTFQAASSGLETLTCVAVGTATITVTGGPLSRPIQV